MFELALEIKPLRHFRPNMRRTIGDGSTQNFFGATLNFKKQKESEEALDNVCRGGQGFDVWECS